jgi:hypothetical protein
MCEEQLVARGDRYAFELLRGRVVVEALPTQEPVAVSVERVAVGVFVAPAKVIDDVLVARELRNAAIEDPWGA